MNKSEKRINESTVIAAAVTTLVLVFYFISEVVGYNKMDLGATPKSFSEVLGKWPRFLSLGMFFFAGIFWWQVSKKEPEYMICVKCMDTSVKGKEVSKGCIKCGGQREELEGFFDRHPEKQKQRGCPTNRRQR